MTHKHPQSFHTIFTFVRNEFTSLNMETHCDIALTLVDYSNSLIDMINEDKEMAKETIIHDFNGLFNHYGLSPVDSDFLPRLTKN